MTETTDLTAKLFDDSGLHHLNPYEIFLSWFEEAKASEVNDPNAMSLATVDEHGMPDLRVVLLNGHDDRGFVFFTNFESAKGRQLLAHPKAALLFHWKSLRRQVRIRGAVEVVSESEADAYFATRPHLSQIGAHASQQSRPLASRDALIAQVGEYEKQFENKDVPRPAYWSGFRIKPDTIEFWKDGAFRLHDRANFVRGADGWRQTRLYP